MLRGMEKMCKVCFGTTCFKGHPVYFKIEFLARVKFDGLA